jgi:hypothetical protein
VIRLRRLSSRELLAVGGLAFAVSGLAVAADGLVTAAQAGVGASQLGWETRLVEGLWRFRLESCLWFTVGAVAFAAGLRLGAQLGGHREHAARVVAGMALGLAVVATAAILAATDVALVGRVGSGVAVLAPSGRARLATWLLQTITSLAAGGVWLVLAARLTAPPPGPAAELESTDAPGPPRERPRAVVPATAPAPPAAPAEPPPSPAEQAEVLYRDRLAFSPRRTAARELVERIRDLEQQGLPDEATALLVRLGEMAADPR